MEKGQLENKPIFLDFYTPSCQPCKWLDQDVYRNNEPVAYTLNKYYISLKVNGISLQGIPLVEKYKVRGYPTLVFLSKEGKVLKKHTGMLAGSKLLQISEQAMKMAKE